MVIAFLWLIFEPPVSWSLIHSSNPKAITCFVYVKFSLFCCLEKLMHHERFIYKHFLLFPFLKIFFHFICWIISVPTLLKKEKNNKINKQEAVPCLHRNQIYFFWIFLLANACFLSPRKYWIPPIMPGMKWSNECNLNLNIFNIVEFLVCLLFLLFFSLFFIFQWKQFVANV